MGDMDAYNFIGLVGTSLYLLSYFLLNMNKISGDSIKYIIMNMCAASCVAISLIKYYNLPSLIIQISWIIISMVGIFNALKNKKKEENKEDDDELPEVDIA